MPLVCLIGESSNSKMFFQNFFSCYRFSSFCIPIPMIGTVGLCSVPGVGAHVWTGTGAGQHQTCLVAAFSNKTTRHTWAPLPRWWCLWENTLKRRQKIVQERKEWRKELWEIALHSPRLVKKTEEVLHSWGTDSLAAWQDHVKAICPLQPTEDHTGEEGKYFLKETAAHGTDPLRNIRKIQWDRSSREELLWTDLNPDYPPLCVLQNKKPKRKKRSFGKKVNKRNFSFLSLLLTIQINFNYQYS